MIVQELELILASIEVSSPTKEEVHALIGNAPSLRYLSEMNEGALRNIENQWHKIYIGWHSILGPTQGPPPRRRIEIHLGLRLRQKGQVAVNSPFQLVF